jgi:hypothetical protein
MRSTSASATTSGRRSGIGEVPVVVRLLLAAHGARLALVRIEQARFLHHRPAVLEQRDLPPRLELDRLLHEAERVQVLDLAARAELRLARPPHRHVGIAAEGPFLHVAVADADPAHQGVQGARVGHSFLRAAQLRLGHDLEERRAGAVEVDPCHALEVFVQRLPRVLFQVRPRQADGLLPARGRDRHGAALHDRDLVLADLVALRQVRIEVVLARKHRAPLDHRADGEPEAHRQLHCSGVRHGEHTRQREVNCAGLRIGRRAKRGRGAREHLAARAQLRVRLEADHDLPGHRRYLGCGRSSWQPPRRSTRTGSK